MTTESKQARSATGAGTLLGAAVGGLVVGVATAVLGLVVEGSPALAGGMTGAAATTLVLAGGALALDVVARVMPGLSMLLALLTYTCQVLVLTLVMAVVADRASAIPTRWAAVALIAVTLAWTLGHVLLSTRRRIAAFDVALPAARTSTPDGVSDAFRAGAR